MGGRLGGRGTSRSIESHGGGKGCDIGCRRRTAPPRRRRRSAALVVVVAALPPSSSSQRRSHLRRHRNCRRRNSRGVKVARQPSGAGGQPRRCSVARQQGGQAALGLLLAGSLLRRIAVLDPATAAVDVGDAAPSPRPSESGKLHAGDLATAAVDAVTPTETMIHSGGRGRRRRRRRRRGSKGPYERGGGGDGDQAAKGCMDAAATGAKTGSTLSSGCSAAKAPAWMEEFSGDSTLCKKKINRQETRLERFRDRKLDSEMKQQSGGAMNESYLARLMEHGGMAACWNTKKNNHSCCTV
uniref:Uncharacterized protein n=1 Tax=Oryza nivara TaxID=4536 RepID=A0A0E0FH68_ORYNI